MQKIHRAGIGFSVAMLVAFTGTTARAAVRYVLPESPAGGDGLSWATAHTTLAEALNAAQSGDEIWVAAGTHIPGATRTSSFNLRSGVAVFGGFSGTETQRAERNADPETNLCVLSGDIDEDDAPNFGNRGDNCYHVVVGTNADASALLDGFFIRGGQATGSGTYDKRGGGFFATDCSATIRNCVFDDNYALNVGGAAAVFFQNPRFEDCVFRDNFAANIGGGLHAGSATVTITDCLFRTNSAGAGGGLGLATATATVVNTTFDRNTAELQGGAVSTGSNGAANFLQCTFSANSTQGNGGAVFQIGQAVVARACTFVDNTADEMGGGVYLYAASCEIAGSKFLHNTAGDGGGVATSGNASPVLLLNSVFSGNAAVGRGGALFDRFEDTHASVIGCTIAGNSAGIGGGISVYHLATANINYSILWQNTDDSGVGFDAQIRIESGGTAQIANSDINTLTPAYQNNGNFDLAPLFVNALGADNTAGTIDDDLHLMPESPCIARGPLSAFGAGETDVDGEPRVMGGRIDVGADEFTDRPFVFGDLNCDGVRNNFDIDPFVLALSQPDTYAAEFPNCDERNGDVNSDGQFNNFDIDRFVEVLSAP